ncbi:response regulator transcription factor [Arthrobacter sp. A2-55]|uniref:response regulator transcription factor n=1 Tax=Arthrobacter sp. A2-55 TaxID=2897337 RepID=UPI0021CD9B0D|nr:helix-turn-helix transcriptional regulator [Arthrobacter sp. A2-55]MCU6480758.1 helix-turn-helix transcriptional regulator [Arthrobacter sp. A2-55]
MDASSRGVLVVGQHGAGKTWMLGQVVAALGSGATTIRLSPSKALSSVPFGAVNARVGMNLARSTDYYEVLNGLLDQVRSGFEKSENVFLMVDNGEYLDEQSAAVIMQVIMSTDTKLIVVDQPGSHRTYLRELWRDGYLARFEMAPLKSSDVRLFLEDVLDGQVAASAAHYLSSRSAGNPLVLKGLVSGALEEGSLRKVEGVWTLDHPGDKLGSESRDYLQMDLEYLGPESRRIIEILALAGPLPLDILLDVTDSESVDDIQQRDLVAIVPGSTMTMCLSRPATAGPIRRMIPVGRSRRLLAEVSEVFVPDGGTSSDMLINFTRWAVDCGAAVSDEQILAAATRANEMMRLPEALQISSLHVGPAHAGALLAQRSIAHLNHSWAAQACTLALKSLEMAVTPDDGAAALRAAHFAFLPDHNYEVHFASALRSYEDKFGEVSLANPSTRADIDVLTLQAMRDLTLGNSTAALERTLALLDHPMTANRVDQTQLKSLLCEVYSTIGRIGSAAEMAFAVIGELESPEGFPRPDISILAYARSVSAFIYDGDWVTAAKMLEPQIFTNPDLMLSSGGLRDLGEAMMHCRRGHIDEALSLLIPAVGTLSDYDPWLVLHTALGLMAYCRVMHGDIEGAQLPLDRLDALDYRGSKFYALEGLAYAAAARSLAGERERGVKDLYDILHECQESGYAGTELTVLSLLVRVGESGVVPRLGDVAKKLESKGAPFFQSWAEALRTQDPVMLDKASAMAMEYGYELTAVELAAQAQKKFHDRGKVHKSRKTASKLVLMREQMPGLAALVFNSVDRPQMTRREHEVAVLVARGESNNAIAARLNVSLRTIEGHLYRTFIKLDLQSREQLAELMNNDAANTAAIHLQR